MSVLSLFFKLALPLTPCPSPKRRGEKNPKNFVISPLLSGEQVRG